MTQNARQLPSHSVDGSVLDLSTVFDENGNVAAITDNTASARQTRSMSYDGLDRLTATTSPMFGTASYAYDPQDNLTRVQVTGGSQPRDHYYCYNASNQLAFVRSGPNCTGTTSPAVIALAYDVQGNLSIKNGASYAFDFGNRLRTTAGQSYRYDAQGRRVRQDVAGSQLQYSQYAADGRLVWQRDETTNQRIANAYLAGSLLAEISRPLTGSTTTIRYLHTDALGSPIAKTSASGAIIETSEYEPYGRLLNRANDNRAGYTGHVMDAASGLTYMQQRYYDPGIGAFLSVDPVTADSAGGANFNRYRYADGNPYAFIDPDGRSPADQNRKSDASNSPCVGDLCTGHYDSDGTDSGGADIIPAASSHTASSADNAWTLLNLLKPGVFKSKADEKWIASVMNPSILRWGGALRTQAQSRAFVQIGRGAKIFGTVSFVLTLRDAGRSTNWGSGDRGTIAVASGDVAFSALGFTPLWPDSLVYSAANAVLDNTSGGIWIRQQFTQSFCIINTGAQCK